MERLKNQTTSEKDLESLASIAGECLRLFRVFFSFTSHLPEVREAELAYINGSINQAREQITQNSDRETQNEVVNVVEPEKRVEHENDGDDEATGNDGSDDSDDESDLAAECKQMLTVMSQMMKRVQALETKINNKKKNSKKPSNSTLRDDNQNRKKNSEGDQPKDFLEWLKDRNSSMGSSRPREQERKADPVLNGHRLQDKRFPVHKWSVKYDGMDNGRRLNEFVKEVEFNARSEGFTQVELLKFAHHLFTDKARAWYMEVSSYGRIHSWDELVTELKNEFLPVDMDYVYERQACNRRQGAREKFQDYYLDMVRIFRSLSIPWDEKRRFDLLFRNTREDCRIAMLAANVNSIPKMKDFGKRFDSINWQLYSRKDSRFVGRSAQVEEVSQNHSVRPKESRWQNSGQNRDRGQSSKPEGIRIFRKNSDKPLFIPRDGKNDYREREKAKTEIAPTQRSPIPGPSGTNVLQRIVNAYIPPRRDVCFNCHVEGHGFMDCDKERNCFCARCGFPGFFAKECPYCQSKNVAKTAQ